MISIKRIMVVNSGERGRTVKGGIRTGASNAHAVFNSINNHVNISRFDKANW